MVTQQSITNQLNTQQPNSLILDELFEKFTKNCPLKGTTITHYLSRYENYIKEVFGDKDINKITTADVSGLLKPIKNLKKQKTVRSPRPGAPLTGGENVARYVLMTLRTTLGYGVRIGALKENVAQQVKIDSSGKIYIVKAKKVAKVPIRKVPRAKKATPTAPKQKFSIANASSYMPEIEVIENLRLKIYEILDNESTFIMKKNGCDFIKRKIALEIMRKLGFFFENSSMRSTDCRGRGPANAIKRGRTVWYSVDSFAIWLYEKMLRDG